MFSNCTRLKKYLSLSNGKACAKNNYENKPAVDNSVRKRRVKVFYKSTGETFGADEDVKKLLKSNKFVQLEETKLGDCYIIIMFCPITSRVGSDVESAMKDATGNENCFCVNTGITAKIVFV
ncbi:hypothetical protein ILYODFUR_028858 [Ilyodon furcidens]|uniref:Uncharacterized protein n=1 Tax=Ilyodon furcidens TaxID=33524 RepID=A0ABV0TPF3_9TELE